MLDKEQGAFTSNIVLRQKDTVYCITNITLHIFYKSYKELGGLRITIFSLYNFSQDLGKWTHATKLSN